MPLVVDELPGVRAIESAYPHRCNKLGIEVAKIHAMPRTQLTVQRFPMRDATAGSAVNGANGSIAPDILGRGLRMPLNIDRAELEVDPRTTDSPAM